jgi:hypothetical protein
MATQSPITKKVKSDPESPEALLKVALKAMTALDHLTETQFAAIASQGPRLVRILDRYCDAEALRAVSAFFRYCNIHGFAYEDPQDCTLWAFRGKTYVLLDNKDTRIAACRMDALGRMSYVPNHAEGELAWDLDGFLAFHANRVKAIRKTA